MNAIRLAAIGVAMLATAAIGLGSRASYRLPDSETSMLRLSWRLRGEKDEECRKRTPEELAELPVHMRSPEVCEGHLVSYRMTLRIDDAFPITRTFVPAGAKGDRPIFVMHDQALAPGEHTVQVTFEPIEEDEDEDEYEAEEGHVQLSLDTRIRVVPGQIVLITLSEDATALVVKR